ncbi:MAG TPA: hypothetical protein VFV07_11645 [Rhizomicrobium sp.]|nr:hypothetical protein [Rhizomicrobium sp.]
MHVFRFACLGLAALLLAACLPVTSDNPVGSTTGFKPDPALVGLWKGHGEDKNNKDEKDAYFAFLRGEDGDMTAVLITPEKESDDWGSYEVQVATLGANHIMNVRGATKNGKPVTDEMDREIIPMRYDIGKDGKLTLSLLDDKATTAAIKAGRIKGTVHEGSENDCHITASPKELDTFFSTKEGAALFSAKLVVLTKVK